MSFRFAILPLAAFSLSAIVGCGEEAPKPAPVVDTPKAAPGAADKAIAAPVSGPMKAPIKD
jgi:hypothetical protein